MASKERVGVADSVGILFTKADGSIETNIPIRISMEVLRKIAEENLNDEEKKNSEHSETVPSNSGK